LFSLLPELRKRWQGRQRPLPECIVCAQKNFPHIYAVDGSTLEALFCKLKALKDTSEGALAGKICTVIDLSTRLPEQIWYTSEALAHDTGFEDQILGMVKAGMLWIFDRGVYDFTFFDDLIDRGGQFITRLKSNAVFNVQTVLCYTAEVHDRLITLGGENGTCRHSLRLIEVHFGSTWYRYLTSVLDSNLLPANVVADLYRRRWRIEIVFPQLTKTDMFAGWAGRDYVSDLNIFVLDDYSINQQFYQFSLLLKAGVFQPVLDTAAEILDGSGQTRKFVASIHLMNQLLFQILHALEFMIQICSPTLVLGQRDNLIQIGFCEPIHLGLQGNLSTAQIFTSRLQFLRQPATALCSL